MKKLIPLLVLSLLGVACDDLEGTIQAQAPLVLKTKKETITLAAGSHSAKLDVDQDDREIEIKVKNSQGKTKEAKVKYPAGMVIPTYSGTFTIKSTDSGQAFDLTGSIDTDVDTGPSIDSTESCTYTREVVRWREVPVYNKEGKLIRYRRERYTDYETVYGTRDVRYHNKSTTVTGRAQFLEPQNGSTIATFGGSRSWSETVYEYQGRCW